VREFINIRIEIADRIGELFIDREDKYNVLNSAVISELKKALLELEKAEIRVLIITGSGDKSFVAGADVAEMKELSMSEAREFSRDGHQLMQQIEEFPRPVIAAVNGYCLGGGNELMMACDLAVASQEAVFGQPETGLGIIAGYGGTQRLARLVGVRKAKELLYTGRKIDAEKALELGLVNEIVEHHQVKDRARELAREIAGQAPIALKLTKEAVNFGLEEGVEKGDSYEINAFALCFGTEDQKRGLQAFLNKENIEFQGR